MGAVKSSQLRVLSEFGDEEGLADSGIPAPCRAFSGARGKSFQAEEAREGYPLTVLAHELLWEPERGWRHDAACRNLDVDVFFPAEEAEEATHEAKAICAECPVADACLEYALATNQADGVWGGLDANERRRMRRRIRDKARRKAS